MVVDPSELTTSPSPRSDVGLYAICLELIEAPPFDPSENVATNDVDLMEDMTGLLGADGTDARSMA
jgi:hypothetical protein